MVAHLLVHQGGSEFPWSPWFDMCLLCSANHFVDCLLIREKTLRKFDLAVEELSESFTTGCVCPRFDTCEKMSVECFMASNPVKVTPEAAECKAKHWSACPLLRYFCTTTSLAENVSDFHD